MELAQCQEGDHSRGTPRGRRWAGRSREKLRGGGGHVSHFGVSEAKQVGGGRSLGWGPVFVLGRGSSFFKRGLRWEENRNAPHNRRNWRNLGHSCGRRTPVTQESEVTLVWKRTGVGGRHLKRSFAGGSKKEDAREIGGRQFFGARSWRVARNPVG